MTIQQFQRKIARRVALWKEKWHVPSAQTQAVLDVWQPKNKPETVLLRWFMTEWCNFNCRYCPQNHDRKADIGDGFTAHCFDNFSLQEWLDAFDRHFSDKQLSLVMTGGEPMLDFQNMHAFLKHMTARPQVVSIRIDTNASWKPEKYTDMDVSKITLMCTFHPGQVSDDAFYDKIKTLLDLKFNIGMINYVMDADNVPLFTERFERFAKLGVYLHPNPLWGKHGEYAPADLALMQKMLPEADYIYRNEIAKTIGKPCYFPSLSYEMNAKGIIKVGCLSNKSVSFFANELLPRPASRVPCPHQTCVCLDKYSFLEGVDRNTSLDPLRSYSDELWSRYKNNQ